MCSILMTTNEFTSHKTGQVFKRSLWPPVSPPTLITQYLVEGAVNNMWARLDNSYTAASAAIILTSGKGGLKNLQWQNILTAWDTHLRT